MKASLGARERALPNGVYPVRRGFSLVVTLAVYAFANLLWIPDSVTNRVAALLANALRGSVYERGQWVVPPDPD